MTLADTVNGPEWLLWIVLAIFIILTIVLLSGHGSWLIAGYNTASKEEKEKYDSKKICRIVGFGMTFICLLILIMSVWMHELPASFTYVSLVLVIIDCVVMIVLTNTIGRKN